MEPEKVGMDSDRIPFLLVVKFPQEGIHVRPLWKDVVTAIFMGMLLPGVLLNFAVMLLDSQIDSEPVQETIPQEMKTVSLPMRLRKPNGSVEEMDMDDYLTGVVLAEMPASFETEALKAQAVVARTYTRKAYETGGKHGNGSVCTNATCCQAYLSSEDYLAKGGTQEELEKIRSAVEDTSGFVLTYEGELIEATYFSCSGGSTEDAVAVWGTDYPYLQAMPSPGEENAAHHTDIVTFTPQQFQNALGVMLKGSPQGWFGLTTYTEGGGVAVMTIGGEAYTGTQLRALLNLRSTAFAVSADENAITITTKGYGHRVGMSQYGADAMAVAGSSFGEILAYYYQGTALKKIT